MLYEHGNKKKRTKKFQQNARKTERKRVGWRCPEDEDGGRLPSTAIYPAAGSRAEPGLKRKGTKRNLLYQRAEKGRKRARIRDTGREQKRDIGAQVVLAVVIQYCVVVVVVLLVVARPRPPPRPPPPSPLGSSYEDRQRLERGKSLFLKCFHSSISI